MRNPYDITPPPPPDAAAFAKHNAGITRSAREYDAHPIAFATDSLCETCQTRPRYQKCRKCSTCRKGAGK